MQASSANDPEPDDLTTSQLRRALYRFDCPSALRLGEYHLDLLAPEARTVVAAHTLECDECRADLADLRHFLATEPAISVQQTLPEQLRRLVANLFAPSPRLALGLRGGADSPTRVYQVEHVSITVGPGSRPHALLGLVLVEGTDPQALAGREVRLIDALGTASETTLDEIGNFEVEDVAPGLYVLELHLADAVVVVEELRVD